MLREVHLYTLHGSDSSFPSTCHPSAPTSLSAALPTATITMWLLVEQWVLAHSNGGRN